MVTRHGMAINEGEKLGKEKPLLPLQLKKLLQYPSHRIFLHVHDALNAVEKIINYTV